MNAIEKQAEEMGIKTYVENGRRKFEGRAGQIIKLWASIGYDVTVDHEGNSSKSWEVKNQAGSLVALILTAKDAPGYAYSYTTKD